MNRLVTAAVILSLIAGTTAGGAAITQVVTLDEQVQTLEHKRQVEVGKTDAARADRREAVTARDKVQATFDAQAAVLAARPSFVKAVTSASDALAAANGKVSVTKQKDAVLAAQKKVAAEKLNADVVKAQTKAVEGVTAKVKADIASYDKRVAEEAARKAAAQRSGSYSNPSAGSSKSTGSVAKPVGKGWLAEARAMVREAGGSFVTVREFDGWCGSKKVVACNFGINDIAFARGWANADYGYRKWVVVHEVAHSYQRMVWGKIHASPKFQTLFYGEIELQANCMAAVRGSTWGARRCSSAAIEYARGIWNGVVG